MLWTREFLSFLALLGPWKSELRPVLSAFLSHAGNGLDTMCCLSSASMIKRTIWPLLWRWWLCRGEASNPGTWTGSKITFGQTCLSSLPPLYLSTLPETGPNFTPFVSFEPSTRYSWAGQCRAAVLILHIFSYYTFTILYYRECTKQVCYSRVNNGLVYPQILWTKVYVVYTAVWFLLNELLLLLCVLLALILDFHRTGAVRYTWISSNSTTLVHTLLLIHSASYNSCSSLHSSSSPPSLHSLSPHDS